MTSDPNWDPYGGLLPLQSEPGMRWAGLSFTNKEINSPICLFIIIYIYNIYMLYIIPIYIIYIYKSSKLLALVLNYF